MTLCLRLPYVARHMPIGWAVVLSGLLFVFLGGCARVETPKITPVIYRFYVAADANAAPLLTALTDTYTKLNPNVIFRVSVGTPAAVADQVANGQVELAATSLLLPAGPNQADGWVGDLASDGIAVIVNAQNPVSELSLPHVRDIFGGSRNQWAEFAAANGSPTAQGEIEVAVRDSGEGTRAAFDRAVMGNVRLTTSAVVLPTSDVMANYVALKPNAIGYVPLSHLRSKPNPKIKAVAVEGAPALADTVASGAYKPQFPLNFVAASEPQGELRRFVAWALGEQGQKVVEASNFVGLSRAGK